MSQEGFAWWTRRLRRACRLYDETRIDHFRGLAGYWAVDATSDTAKFGKWKVGPGVKLFEALKKNLGDVTIVAEDLGVITPDVVEVSGVTPFGTYPSHLRLACELGKHRFNGGFE